MLGFYGYTVAGRIEVDLDAKVIPPEVTWIDAFRPEAREIAFLERALAITVPTLADLSEIESSSRLYRDKDVLFLSTPTHYHTVGGRARTTPLGFVLSKNVLLSIRFKPLKAFYTLNDKLANQALELPGGLGALISVLEVIVERTADELEGLAGDLDSISDQIFNGETGTRHEDMPQATNDRLRLVLRRIGRAGDHAAKISDVLLGMGRMVPFVVTNVADHFADSKTRLKSLQRDIASLGAYERRLTEQIQFLLDATLGLTNIDQNDIFRILTAVSVVGIPPTFITSLYGMNFKIMPELDWTYGYGFALGLIALSAILPILWFKRKGWW